MANVRLDRVKIVFKIKTDRHLSRALSSESVYSCIRIRQTYRVTRNQDTDEGTRTSEPDKPDYTATRKLPLAVWFFFLFFSVPTIASRVYTGMYSSETRSFRIFFFFFFVPPSLLSFRSSPLGDHEINNYRTLAVRLHKYTGHIS